MMRMKTPNAPSCAVAARVSTTVPCTAAPISGDVRRQGEEDGKDVGDEEQQEDRHQGHDGFLDAPQVQDGQDEHAQRRRARSSAAACESGRKLKMASAPLAMESVMVST